MLELLPPGHIGASANCSRQTDSGVGEKLGNTMAKFGLSSLRIYKGKMPVT